MRKRILVFALLAAMLLTVPVAAAPRASLVRPTISFNGTTATCKVRVTAESVNDSITADITLYEGSRCIESWTATGTGTLTFTDTVTVKSGKTYTLSVDAVVAGVAMDTAQTSKTCP